MANPTIKKRLIDCLMKKGKDFIVSFSENVFPQEKIKWEERSSPIMMPFSIGNMSQVIFWKVSFREEKVTSLVAWILRGGLLLRVALKVT